jgi:hypothetical protein
MWTRVACDVFRSVLICHYFSHVRAFSRASACRAGQRWPGIWISPCGKCSGEAFQPALITRDPAGRDTVTRLAALGLKVDNVFDFACGRLRELAPPEAAVVVMDGNVTLEGEHFDAVIVRVGRPATDHSHEFAQR